MSASQNLKSYSEEQDIQAAHNKKWNFLHKLERAKDGAKVSIDWSV